MTNSGWADEVVVLSGYPQGDSGVGRVLAYLMGQSQQAGFSVKFIARRRYDINLRKMLKVGVFAFLRSVYTVIWSEIAFAGSVFGLRRSSAKVVLIHPQAIGFRRVLNLIQTRSAPTWLYVMDASFFCLRSYNQLNPLDGACFRCLQASFKTACQPFPVVDPWAHQFTDRLAGLVELGKLFFLTQNVKQTELVQRRFVAGVRVEQIGLWAADWSPLMQTLGAGGENQKFDVVFHGNPFDAKGFSWALALAKSLPSYSFLFPFFSPSEEIFPNCAFLPMSWESGLADHVSHAQAVLVPSLWSAPIEGALIKSLQCSSRVVVAEETSAFSSELSEDLVFRLSMNVELASQQLRGVLQGDQDKSRETIDDWLNDFSKTNRPVMHRLYAVVTK